MVTKRDVEVEGVVMTTEVRTDLGGLPTWEEKPADVTGAILEIKAALKAQIATSGRTVRNKYWYAL